MNQGCASTGASAGTQAPDGHEAGGLAATDETEATDEDRSAEHACPHAGGERDGVEHHRMDAHPSHPSHHSEGLHHDFSDADAWAKRFDAPDRDAWQRPEEVVAQLELSAGSRVVDLGAGTGYFLPHLSDAVGSTGQVIGLDVEPSLVAHMEKRIKHEKLANVTARAVQPNDPGLAAGSVDRILIVDTWHHLDDRERYAKKLFDALAPGGMLVIVDYTKESVEGPPPEFRLSSEDVIATLEKAGFRAELSKQILPRQYMVVGRRR